MIQWRGQTPTVLQRCRFADGRGRVQTQHHVRVPNFDGQQHAHLSAFLPCTTPKCTLHQLPHTTVPHQALSAVFTAYPQQACVGQPICDASIAFLLTHTDMLEWRLLDCTDVI